MGIDLKDPSAEEKPFPFDYLSRFADPAYTYESLIADLGSMSYGEDIYKVGEHLNPRGPTTGVCHQPDSQEIDVLRFTTQYLFDQLKAGGFFGGSDRTRWKDVYMLYFQKGEKINNGCRDIVRLYLNPMADKETLKIFIDQFIGLLKDPSTPSFSGKFFPENFFSDFNNRFIICMDRTDEGLTRLLRAMSGNQTLLNTLEEDGGWMSGQRIPLAKGVSFVEGTTNSWDSNDLDEIIWQTKLTREALMQIGRNPTMFQLRLRNK